VQCASNGAQSRHSLPGTIMHRCRRRRRARVRVLQPLWCSFLPPLSLLACCFPGRHCVDGLTGAAHSAEYRTPNKARACSLPPVLSQAERLALCALMRATERLPAHTHSCRLLVLLGCTLAVTRCPLCLCCLHASRSKLASCLPFVVDLAARICSPPPPRAPCEAVSVRGKLFA